MYGIDEKELTPRDRWWYVGLGVLYAAGACALLGILTALVVLAWGAS